MTPELDQLDLTDVAGPWRPVGCVLANFRLLVREFVVGLVQGFGLDVEKLLAIEIDPLREDQHPRMLIGIWLALS